MEITWLRGVAVLVLLALAGWGAGRKLRVVYRLIRLGGGPVPVVAPSVRLRELVRQVAAHSRVLRQPFAGMLHLFIFYGFLVLLSTIVQALGEAFVSGWTLPFVGGAAWFAATQDVFILLVLAGVGMALWLRLVVRPTRFGAQDQFGAFLILGMIGGIVVTLVLSRAAQIALHAPSWGRGAVVSSFVAGWFAAAPAGLTRAVFEASWWAHLGIILYFLTWIPDGKHLHLVTLVPNVMLAKARPRGALAAVDVETAERLGASQAEHFTWKDNLDVFACMECGRCVDVCPANATGKELDPRRLHTDLRQQLELVGPALLAGQEPAARPALVGAVFSEEFLWQCLTCGACVEECPATNDHIDKIVEMRRHLVMEEARVPSTMEDALRSLEARGHPFRGAGLARTAWTAGVEIPRLADGDRPEWLLWVGCAAAMNERNHTALRAFVRLLHTAGLEVGILGDEETCTGDPARRMGNEYLFQTFARRNVEILNGYGISKIVTTCPHCYNTLKHEYPAFGGRYDVWHHTQLLARLIDEGRLRSKDPTTERITFHDPCYLGRHNGEYEAPRRVLATIPDGAPVEMTQTRDRSFCCGAGGGLYWMEDRVGERVSHARTRQAAATGAQVVAVACPFCMLMLEDGATATETAIRPMDVAELFDQSLGEERRL